MPIAISNYNQTLTSVESLLPDSSKRTILRAAQIVDSDPALFYPMLDFSLQGKPKVSARAIRVIIVLSEIDPALLTPYRDVLLDKLSEMSNQSVMFNLLHLFILMDLPDDDEYLGRLTDICINLLNGTFERRAIKVFSLDILYRISKIYPEFSRELEHIVRSQMIDAYPALYSRGQKILKLMGCDKKDEY